MCFENARRNPYSLTSSGQLSNFGTRMVDSNSNTLSDVMKADISLGNSGTSNCWTRQMKDAFGDLQNGTVYRSDLLQCRKLNISNMRIDLRFRHQASQFGERHMVKILALV